MKLRRAVYRSPTTGKTIYYKIMKSFLRILLEHPWRAITSCPVKFKPQSPQLWLGIGGQRIGAQGPWFDSRENPPFFHVSMMLESQNVLVKVNLCKCLTWFGSVAPAPPLSGLFEVIAGGAMPPLAAGVVLFDAPLFDVLLLAGEGADDDPGDLAEPV